MALSYKNDNQADERLNPAETGKSIQEQEQQAAYDRDFDDITKNLDKTADPSREDDNIKKVRDQEETPSGTWKNAVTPKSNDTTQPIQGNGKLSNFRKKGPVGFIIALLLGGGGMMSIMFAPGIGIVAIKEMFVNDLNDQLAAADIRSDHVFRAKLKSIQAGGSICSGPVNIRCKFSTLSSRQAAKFRAAGFTIESDTSFAGRERVTKLSFKDSAGNVIEVNDPKELWEKVRANPEFASAVRKAYNPKFATLSDKVANKVLKERFRTDKSKKVVGNTDEEREKSLNAATAGKEAVVGTSIETCKDGDKDVKCIRDANGKTHNEGSPEYDEQVKKIEEIQSKVTESKASGGKVVGSVLKSGVKGLSLTGAADTACTVYNTARAVAATAKVIRALQLAQFAMIFLNIADEIKAGGDKLKPEDVEFVGNIFTTIDTNTTVEDETSITGGNFSGESPSITSAPTANPFFGKNAFDSPGYKAAAYNDAPTLTSRSQQYMVGGGLVGSFSSVMSDIENLIPGGKSTIRSTCSTIQSWWARTLGFIGGLIAAAGTFGASTVVSIGASIAIGFALPFLEAALADMLAGQVVNSSTKGVDAGDAMFAGVGAMLGSMAMSRGMKPANKAEIQQYVATSQRVKNDYIAMETYEARETPFDAYNKYSFLGSITQGLYPTLSRSSSSVSAAFLNVPTIFASAFSALTPQAKAFGEFNIDRFSKCSDEGYAAVGIDADIMCNPRYVLSPEELAMDTDAVLTYMIDNGHIGTEGLAQSETYKTWVERCVERKPADGSPGFVGWGESINDEPEAGEEGQECMAVDAMTQNFRVFTMDNSVNDAMDDEVVAAGTPTPTQSPGTITGGPLGVTTADSRRLAKELADSPNMNWTRSTTDQELLSYASGASVVNGCGAPIAPSPFLTGALVELTRTKYKITASNIGFGSERSCEGGTFQHPKGNAIDIQYIEIIGGAKTSPGLDYAPGDTDVVNQFATDFLALLPPTSRGGVGQKNCGVNPTFPAGSTALFGAHLFTDSCDHVHIDVRNRENLSEAMGQL